MDIHKAQITLSRQGCKSCFRLIPHGSLSGKENASYDFMDISNRRFSSLMFRYRNNQSRSKPLTVVRNDRISAPSCHRGIKQWSQRTNTNANGCCTQGYIDECRLGVAAPRNLAMPRRACVSGRPSVIQNQRSAKCAQRFTKAGEHPLNLAPTNMVWMDAQDLTWINTQQSENGPKVAWLWGNLSVDGISGSLVKFPGGYAGQISTTDGDLKAVVIKGTLQHHVGDASDIRILGSGDYFASADNISHSIKCEPSEECLIYVRTRGRFRVQ